MLQPAKLHQLSLADESRHREPVSQAFTERAQIRNNTVNPLRTSQVPAKAADHFIEDEDGPVLPAQCLDLSQKVVGRRGFLLRLHDETGDLAWILLKQCLYALHRVVTELYSQFPNAVWDPCRPGRGPDEPIVCGKERMVFAH